MSLWRRVFWFHFYPLNYAHRHPWLALCVWWNYRLRQFGLAPNCWHEKDIELMRRLGSRPR